MKKLLFLMVCVALLVVLLPPAPVAAKCGAGVVCVPPPPGNPIWPEPTPVRGCHAGVCKPVTVQPHPVQPPPSGGNWPTRPGVRR